MKIKINKAIAYTLLVVLGLTVIVGLGFLLENKDAFFSPFITTGKGPLGYSYNTKQVQIIKENTDSTIKFNVQIADTEGERELGLSYRSAMEDKSGMFFDFPSDSTNGFWMKGMKFNLDIIFISSDYKIIKIFKQLQPCSDDLSKCLGYAPDKPYRYVLEINGGLSDKLGITEGQTVVVK